MQSGVTIKNNRSLSIQQKAELIPSLKFNDKEIVMTNVDGVWWFAIKPICEMLNIDYEQQRRNINTHEIFGQLPCVHTATGADGKYYKMICLPEDAIHFWIFGLQGIDKDLFKNKYKLHLTILHFFNAPDAERKLNLKRIAALQLRNAELDKIVAETPEQKERRENDKLISQLLKSNKSIDDEKVKSEKQILLFDMQNNPLNSNQLPGIDMVVED